MKKAFGSFALVILLSSCSCEDSSLSELTPLISPEVLLQDFGDVYIGASPTLDVRAIATGTAPVNVYDVIVTGAGFSLVEFSEVSLSPGEALDLSIRFSPNEIGTRSGSVILRNTSENLPELEIALSATGLAALECENDNPCVQLNFDPELGECVSTNVEGGCDDESACTENDQCVDGECLGSTRECPAADLCSVGVCSDERGCFSVPDSSACDDGNPCTLDGCDPDEGCTHEAFENGTPCGIITGCSEVPICLFGECTIIEAPDGAPCSDGDICTTGDQCLGGECFGERVERVPEVVGSALTFGGYNSALHLLSDERALFYDSGRLTLVSLPELVRLATHNVDTEISVLDSSTIIAGFAESLQIFDLSNDTFSPQREPFACELLAAGAARIVCIEDNEVVVRDGPSYDESARHIWPFEYASALVRPNKSLVVLDDDFVSLLSEDDFEIIGQRPRDVHSLSFFGDRIFAKSETLLLVELGPDLQTLFEFPGEADAFALYGGRLLKERRGNGLELWDIQSSPPELLNQAPVWLDLASRYFGYTHSETSSYVSGYGVVYDTRTFPPTLLDTNEMGAPKNVVATDRLFAFSSSGVREIDFSEPTNPVFGPHTNVYPKSVETWSFGGPLRAPLFGKGNGPINRVDAFDPANLVFDGDVFDFSDLPFNAIWSWQAEGLRFAAVGSSDVEIKIITGSVTDFSQSRERLFTTPQATGGISKWEFGGSRLLYVDVNTVIAFDPTTDETAFVSENRFLVGVFFRNDFAFAAGRILSLEDSEITLFALGNDELVQIGDALELTGLVWPQLLFFDGRIAIVSSFSEKLFFIDTLSPSGPQVTLELPLSGLSGRIHSVTAFEDHLIFGAEAGVEVVSPPCPPLP